MKRFIGYFRKTDHFMKRQWFRYIEDSFLEKLLPKFSKHQDSNAKKAIIISRNSLKKMNIMGKETPKLKQTQHLVIILESNRLVTIYISDYANDAELLKSLSGYSINFA